MILDVVFADGLEQELGCGTVLFSSPTHDVSDFSAVVYGLCDPRDVRRIRYVGQTESPMQRYHAHCYPSSGGMTLLRWLRSLREDGVYPIMMLLEGVPSHSRRLGVETRWIRRLQRHGMADLNRAPVLRNTLRLCTTEETP